MKRAFTLAELLVYMAILGFIIVVAGRVFSDSTSMRIRSQNLLKSSAEIGKLANLITEDISQMGIKAFGKTTSDGFIKVEPHSAVYWDISNTDEEKKDFSSYTLIRKPLADSLVFKKAVFDKNGKFIAVREIALYAKGDSLFRKCRQVTDKYPDGTNADGESDGDCKSTASNINSADSVLMAINVTNFKLTPSIAEQEILFNNSFGLYYRESGYVRQPGNCQNSGTITKVSGFNSNYAEPPDIPGNAKYELYLGDEVQTNCTPQYQNCKVLTFGGQKTYVIEFKMPFNSVDDKSTQFQPSIDHLSIGLRTYQGDKVDVPDVLFYPPQDATSEDMARHIEFSIKKDKRESITACVAITMAFYSPSANEGVFMFEDFKVFQKAEESINFPKPDDPDYDISNENYGIGKVEGTEQDIKKKVKEKKSVKAFELLVEMAIGTEKRKSGTFSQKGRGIIVATPNNGVIVEVE
jgi:type II secretory pathway pseudopilin PulG